MKTTQYLIGIIAISFIFSTGLSTKAANLKIIESMESNHTSESFVYQQGWVAEGNKWFYLGQDGNKMTGLQNIEGKYEWFDQLGSWKQSMSFDQWMTGYENVDRKLNEVLTNIIQDSMSDIEKLNKIKMWMINSMKYETVEMKMDNFGYFETDLEKIGISQRDIYGAYALLNGKGVCTHYAELFKIMANSLGYKTITMNGTWRNQSHAWNATRINNQWYYSDLTLADSSLANHQSYFLMDELDQDYQEYSLADYQRVASYQSYTELKKSTSIEVISTQEELISAINNAYMNNKKELLIFYVGEPQSFKRYDLIEIINAKHNIISDIQIINQNHPYLMLDNIYRGKLYQLQFINYDEKIIEWMRRYGNLNENDIKFNR